ncbi:MULTISPECIES: HD domain-containing protein [unclassified Pseudomonas]|uniref:HD domain-containing protein n=1 Tax=unclassified Pseudomonas TaxID=196821 RepID=UPI0038086B8F
MLDKKASMRAACHMLKTIMLECKKVKLSNGETLLEHSLWSAHQALTEGCAEELIVAALFHDIGHFLCNSDPEMTPYEKDCQHADLGAQWLNRWFPQSVCIPIQLHIDAKRYLITVNENYNNQLSSGSLSSLLNQGGRMTSEEILAFQNQPYHHDALSIRKFDDTPYDNGFVNAYSRYEKIIMAVMR